MSESHEERHPARTAARVDRSRWPGWIWAVPIAALGVVTWLGVNALFNQGVDVMIAFDRANGISSDTKVEYRGITIGKVTDVSLSSDGGHVTATVHFDEEAKRYLTTGTRFWLEGASPSLSDLSSLIAIISGPTIEMAPGPGAPDRRFEGLDHRPTLDAPARSLVRYTVFFNGAVGQLKRGAPVTLHGFTVGEVEGIAMRFNAGRLETPVVMALEPARFNLDPSSAHEAPRAMLDPVVDRLIGHGLRAELVQNPPLVGDYAVALDFVDGVGAAHLESADRVTVFPAYSGGGINSIIERANQVPIDKIAAQVLAITQQVHAIVASPSLRESVVNLNQTLAALNRTVRRSGPQITALIGSLRSTATELEVTANAANRVLGASPANQDSNVRVALYELTETARSVRTLADYLSRHPDALLRGNAG